MRTKDPASLFGRRLREARERSGLPQDRLGIAIGLDEGTASARISRYETGIHAPPFETAVRLAGVLKVPPAFLYCPEDELARVILWWHRLSRTDRKRAKAMIDAASPAPPQQAD
jgi:transcriptional regulator with XRE-family HTH domain